MCPIMILMMLLKTEVKVKVKVNDNHVAAIKEEIEIDSVSSMVNLGTYLSKSPLTN